MERKTHWTGVAFTGDAVVASFYNTPPPVYSGLFYLQRNENGTAKWVPFNSTVLPGPSV